MTLVITWPIKLLVEVDAYVIKMSCLISLKVLNLKGDFWSKSNRLLRELDPGPRMPEAGIILLDQAARIPALSPILIFSMSRFEVHD